MTTALKRKFDEIEENELDDISRSSLLHSYFHYTFRENSEKVYQQDSTFGS
jgi:hypothetical protein